MSNITILKWNDAERYVKDYFKKSKEGKLPKNMPIVKGYFRVGKRDYTAFRITSFGLLRQYQNLQHEGDCRTKLKLSPVL